MSMLKLFKNQELKLVQKRQESLDGYSFIFESQKPLDWKAGQHGIFSFKNEKLTGGNYRMFSIASAPTEQQVMIGTKISEHASDFKVKLQSMEIGDRIYLRGPFGGFYISDLNQNVALIAAGIGITPMRAILKNIEYSHREGRTTLFYLDSKKHYIYQKELQAIKTKDLLVDLLYLENRNDLKESILEYVNQYGNNSSYFLSGPPKMVKAIKQTLKDKGIKGRNIITDSFRGY